MAPDPRQLRAQRFPLHAAVESGDLARTRALLEGSLRFCIQKTNNYQVNHNNFPPRSQINRKYEGSGQTPLHLAAGCGDQAMMPCALIMFVVTRA